MPENDYADVSERVLVACPTYLGKNYALEAYVRAYNDFAYPRRGLFMVDNTGHDLAYFEHLKKLGVPCVHVQPSRNWQETFARSWKAIAKHAKAEGFEWVASIEADNICPPLTLDILLNIAGYTRAVHVAHSYLWHDISGPAYADQVAQSTKGRLMGLGCNLILTSLLDAVFSAEKWATDAFEAEIFEWPKREGKVTIEVHNLIDVRHFNAKPGEEFYQFGREPIPEFTPGTTDEQKPYADMRANPFRLN